jgi:hypothetical protein
MKRGFKLKTYLAGAALANAPILILNYLLLSSMHLSSVLSSILSYGVCFATSVIAGYLVAGNLSGNPIKAGMVTGVLSYIIYATLVAVLLPVDTWDLVAFLGFLMGGCVGSKIWEVSPKSIQ